MHAQANMYEYLPKEVVREGLSLLFLDGCTQVTMLAVLHDNTNSLLRDETVIVANDEMTIDFCHDLDLLHCLERCMLW